MFDVIIDYGMICLNADHHQFGIQTVYKHNPFVKDIILIIRNNYALRCLWNFSHHG